MQIDVSFQVYQALTCLRRSEEDSYSDVLQRLLTLSDDLLSIGQPANEVRSRPNNILAAATINEGRMSGRGAWIGNVLFPNATKFRATYKGRTFRAEIKDELWIDEKGGIRKSPSEAAGAICGTNVNGWRFWYAMRPTDSEWKRLDEFRK